MQGIDNGDYEAAANIFEHVLELAHHYGDAALELQTLAWSATVDFYHLRLSECLYKSQKALNLAQAIGDPRIEANSEFWALLVLATTGSIH
jgi:hypothetical protein